MIEKKKIYQFDEAWSIALLKTDGCANKRRLLLGNGFSMAYNSDFGQKTLFNAVKEIKGHANIVDLFEYFGESNFESVLKSLKDAQHLFKVYGIENDTVRQDYEKIRDALADAIVKVHPEKTTTIPEEHKQNCFDFLSHFDDIYTVNYDLLLYWTIMHDPKLSFGDYFGREQDTEEEYCEYISDGGRSSKHVYFLHGAIHIFLKDGATIKKVWGGMAPLINQVKEEIENGYYPWVVAEGNSASKVEQIKSNPYLEKGYSKLRQQQGHLFTFGFSFSEQDNHIVDAIINNEGIRHLWIGIRGDLKKNKSLVKMAEEMIEKRKIILEEKGQKKISTKSGPLNIHFYDTGSMDIWGVK